MKRRGLGPFIPTTGRNPAYATQGGEHWIVRQGSGWHLYQSGNTALGRERLDLGRFPTLTAAVAHHREQNYGGQ